VGSDTGLKKRPGLRRAGMHGIRRLLLTAMVGASMLVAPADAFANGGSYLEFDRTHYLPGDQGVALAYVSVPRKHEDLFERGPFYLFAVPDGSALREGRPIPRDAIRLGTFTIEDEKGDAYELRAAFTTPPLASGSYVMALCNDPCTISGFRDPLAGSVSIVATRREADLLMQNGRLRSRLFGLKHEARRAQRRLAATEEQLEAQLAFGSSERAELSAEIERLEVELASVRERAAAQPARTPFDPWVVGAILLVTFVAAVLAFRRRRYSMISEMEDHRRDEDRRTGASSIDDGSNGRARTGARTGAPAR
jgi:hypothetical protein